ncbi:Flavin monooxygenase-like protein [Metarhizium album ARSEF 1941]|uniref:Flavin monooxygenase-like protein n=1 Tax=Metarhizium album (strain ARSEF 1941) TaxID=1081103 RepID=A0A0B2X1K6_METAS|nr:Flavin monooxygenase-like protein [Metarhizium album ARSEF 1941]KHN98960.1 Flavin monooxygenase-like protein [Metarhizium album ARSEF 1941]
MSRASCILWVSEQTAATYNNRPGHGGAKVPNASTTAESLEEDLSGTGGDVPNVRRTLHAPRGRGVPPHHSALAYAQGNPRKDAEISLRRAGPAGLLAAKNLLCNAPKDSFTVTVFDLHGGIGGLWPTSKEDTTRQVHPLMIANQSKHTMQFSDHAWEDGAPQLPRAWQVGRYLERYVSRYLTSHPHFTLRLNTRVVRAEQTNGDGSGWDVRLESRGQGQTQYFDYLVVASGYFGKPVVPECMSISPSATIPVIHSSQYRDLKQLLQTRSSAKGNILIVGGQMSGVEVSGTIATHLSSATNSPSGPSVPDLDQCSIRHIIQRPIWVFPLHTTAEVSVPGGTSLMIRANPGQKPKAAAAPFLPLDFSSYNRNNRPLPLFNTQGHVDVKTAQAVNGIFHSALGTDQSTFSPLLHVDDAAKAQPPYLAVSDWYCDFVRSGLISLSNGKVESFKGSTARLDDGTEIKDVVAIVLATGFDPSPCISYLPTNVLKILNHSPQHMEQPLALAFHGTHHPNVSALGFVGFYRSPYWGVMQMQARFLAEYWSTPMDARSEAMNLKLKSDNSIQRTLDLRDDPRLSQFPMGDYPFLMQEFSEALSIPRVDPSLSGIPMLSYNSLPLDMLTPARYPSPSDDVSAKTDAEKMRQDTVQVAIDGLATPRFVPRAVFRSLLGTWKLERELASRLPTHPSGHFSGTARFLLRDKTSDGLQCARQGLESTVSDEGAGLEYLYIEDGEFKTEQGFGFRASRRYIWRYDDNEESLSVWFTKPEDPKRADYLFHQIEFLQPEKGRDEGWSAKAGHVCIDDYYDVQYNFEFEAVNLKNWSIEYTVNGPKKDYSIRGAYAR